MKGQTVFEYPPDKYIEIVLEEEGRARLVQCTKAGVTIKYRIETTKHGYYQHSTTDDIYKAMAQYEQYRKQPDFYLLEVTDIADYNEALIALAHATQVYEIKPYVSRLSALFPSEVMALAAAYDCETSTYCRTEVKVAAYAF